MARAHVDATVPIFQWGAAGRFSVNVVANSVLHRVVRERLWQDELLIREMRQKTGPTSHTLFVSKDEAKRRRDMKVEGKFSIITAFPSSAAGDTVFHVS